MLTTMERMQRMLAFLLDKADTPGCVIEVGVFQGDSLKLLAEARPLRQCYGYDTFAGLPSPSAADNFHQTGQYQANLEDVRKNLMHHPNVELVPGIYPASDLGHDNVILAHVDVDLYIPTLEAFRTLWPKLVPGGRIYCDDAFHLTCTGATRAFFEFCFETKVEPCFVRELMPPFAFVEKPL